MSGDFLLTEINNNTIPIFAFTNAGVPVRDINCEQPVLTVLADFNLVVVDYCKEEVSLLMMMLYCVVYLK